MTDTGRDGDALFAQQFFTVAEIARAAGRPYQTVHDWLTRAGVIERNAAGAPLIRRELLAVQFPELLEAWRRYVTLEHPERSRDSRFSR